MRWRICEDKDGRTERGAAAVEFALVVPILLLILFGIITFGAFLGQQLALSNSARQAARFGVVEGRTCADIIQEAKNNANSIAMSGAATTVVVTRGGAACTGATQACKGSTTGQSVVVTASYASTPLAPVPGIGTVNLSAKGEFRCEFS